MNTTRMIPFLKYRPLLTFLSEKPNRITQIVHAENIVYSTMGQKGLIRPILSHWVVKSKYPQVGFGDIFGRTFSSTARHSERIIENHKRILNNHKES